MIPTVPDSKLLYYGEVHEYGMVFVRHADVCRLARIYRALSSSATWDEFASKVPAGVMREVLNDSTRVSFDNFRSLLGRPNPQQDCHTVRARVAVASRWAP
jgi:hypothetical protein